MIPVRAIGSQWKQQMKKKNVLYGPNNTSCHLGLFLPPVHPLVPTGLVCTVLNQIRDSLFAFGANEVSEGRMNEVGDGEC